MQRGGRKYERRKPLSEYSKRADAYADGWRLFTLVAAKLGSGKQEKCDIIIPAGHSYLVGPGSGPDSAARKSFAYLCKAITSMPGQSLACSSNS